MTDPSTQQAMLELKARYARERKQHDARMAKIDAGYNPIGLWEWMKADREAQLNLSEADALRRFKP